MKTAYAVEKEAVRQNRTLSGSRDPVDLLRKAYEAVSRSLGASAFIKQLIVFPQCQKITGSATAVIATIHNNTLSVANLGDSVSDLMYGNISLKILSSSKGVMVVRNGQVKEKMKEKRKESLEEKQNRHNGEIEIESHYLFVSQVVLRSKEQQKAFNFPYQLGTDSPDRPHHAQKYTLDLQERDVVVREEKMREREKEEREERRDR
jgi:hypothetical protein